MAVEGIEKCEYKGTNSFDESSIMYKIRCYSRPVNKYELKRAALRLIQNRLNEKGIKIPYRYLNVVVKPEEENTDIKAAK